MGGFGGGLVAIAERSDWSISGALSVSMLTATGLAVLGAIIAPRARSNARS
jgi:hypothetical protein